MISLKACTKCGVEKPFEQFFRSKTRRDGRHPNCKVCQAAYKVDWYSRNREKVAAQGAIYREKNARIISARAANSYAENKDRFLTRNAAWKALNAEPYAQQQATYRARNADTIAARVAQWAVDNPHAAAQRQSTYRTKYPAKVRAATARRRAAKLQATPHWADLDAIEDFYAAAAMFRTYTGQTYHVDHIVPLRSPLVCGLHNEFNLQVLPGTENCRKQNRYWPDMP